MGNAPDASMPESMYSNRTEEMLCICADSNGIGIELVDTEVREYWLTPGVTGWSQERLREWAEELLHEGSSRDFAIGTLPDGPVTVEIYDEVEYWSERQA